MGEKQKLIKKERSFSGPIRWLNTYQIPYRGNKVICNFFDKNFHAGKTDQYSNLRKEIVKRYEGFGPVESPANLRADLSIQENK